MQPIERYQGCLLGLATSDAVELWNSSDPAPLHPLRIWYNTVGRAMMPIPQVRFMECRGYPHPGELS